MFSKIELRSRYHQLKIKPKNVPKTAFRMRYGHYEFLVMSICLKNTPAVFIDLMNRVFSDFLDKFVIVFIDDILVYSKSHEEHEQCLKLLLQQFNDKRLYAKFSKCNFCLEEVAFLGHIIRKEGVLVDLEKVKGVVEQYDRSAKFSWFGRSLSTFYRRVF